MMSLRQMHIFFIALCVALSFLMTLWAIMRFRLDSSPPLLVTSLVSFVVAIALLCYLRWFLQKSQGPNLHA